MSENTPSTQTVDTETASTETASTESTETVAADPSVEEATVAASEETTAPTTDSATDDAQTGTDEDADTDEQGDEDDDEDDDEGDEDGEDGDPLDVEGEIAADYLEELLDIADLDGDIDTYSENGRAHVSVVTESDALVGANGEVLEALQELTRLAVLTETGNRSRLMLDVAGFREKRRKELESLASDAVEETNASAEPVALSPMNPFERKIVHDFVAAAGLRSESEGEEPQRRVVVQPAS